VARNFLFLDIDNLSYAMCRIYNKLARFKSDTLGGLFLLNYCHALNYSLLRPAKRTGQTNHWKPEPGLSAVNCHAKAIRTEQIDGQTNNTP
jgi:hypothetical protein